MLKAALNSSNASSATCYELIANSVSSITLSRAVSVLWPCLKKILLQRPFLFFSRLYLTFVDWSKNNLLFEIGIQIKDVSAFHTKSKAKAVKFYTSYL